MTKYRTRIAPTPSGQLHLGHLSTFSIAQERAKKAKGDLILRIEDIDKARSKEEYIESICSDLVKFGIICNEGYNIGGEFAPYKQSQRLPLYIDRLKKLIKKGYVYACDKSRSQIAKIAKYSEEDPKEKVYPKEFKNKHSKEIPENFLSLNWRFDCKYGENIEFYDELCGKQSFICGRDFGDFLVWRKSEEASYELAVVCDDIAMEITEVVRGKDLLLSTAKQILLYRAFNAIIPLFAHCPLVLDANKEKLSKSKIQLT